jgi:hypothetical protein
MLPPNSYTQAILKRAEALRSTSSNSSNPTAPTNPPPAYTAAPQTIQMPPVLPPGISIPGSVFLNDQDEYYDYEDDEELEDDVQGTAAAPAPAPVVIKIDTSMKIEGDGNTILLPGATSSFGMRNPASVAAGLTRQNNIDVNSAPAATAGAGQLPTPVTTPHSTTTNANPAPSPPQPSQPRLFTSLSTTNVLTSSLLSALRSAGVISVNPNTSSGATNHSRPLEITIEAGIKVTGSKNVISRGGNGMKIVQKPVTSNSTPVADGSNAGEKSATDGAVVSGGDPEMLGASSGKERKRRAESVCILPHLSPKYLANRIYERNPQRPWRRESTSSLPWTIPPGFTLTHGPDFHKRHSRRRCSTLVFRRAYPRVSLLPLSIRLAGAIVFHIGVSSAGLRCRQRMRKGVLIPCHTSSRLCMGDRGG